MKWVWRNAEGKCLLFYYKDIVYSFAFGNKIIQCDSFGTRPKKMRISQRLFTRFWTCIWLHTLLHEKHVDTSLPLSDRLSKTNQFPVVKGTGLWILLVIWKSSTNLWINLMMTSSETAIFSRMEPHATPRMTAWPKSKAFLMTGLFRKPYGRQDLLT